LGFARRQAWREACRDGGAGQSGAEQESTPFDRIVSH
jgi:hypothetical protein